MAFLDFFGNNQTQSNQLQRTLNYGSGSMDLPLNAMTGFSTVTPDQQLEILQNLDGFQLGGDNTDLWNNFAATNKLTLEGSNITPATGEWGAKDYFGAIGVGVNALQAVGGLYMGYQQNKLAKDTLNFQKDVYNTNVRQQTKAYNNALQDRINGRASDREMSDTQRKETYERDKLTI